MVALGNTIGAQSIHKYSSSSSSRIIHLRRAAGRRPLGLAGDCSYRCSTHRSHRTLQLRWSAPAVAEDAEASSPGTPTPQQQQQQQQQQQPAQQQAQEQQLNLELGETAAQENTAASAAAEASASSGSADAAAGGPAFLWESFYMEQEPAPAPVQLPPPGATPDPPPQRPWFNKLRYRSPRFLHAWEPADPAAYNFMSFLGRHDPHDGRYFVPHHRLDDFLLPYFNTLHFKKRRMYLAENYQGQPYKYFQELDFPWTLDVALVLALLPQVIAIVGQEASLLDAASAAASTPHTNTSSISSTSAAAPEASAAASAEVKTYADDAGASSSGACVVQQPSLSMRTPYKVHLNFPKIWVVEEVSRELRKRIVNRCRVELSGLPPLELLREEQQLQQQVQEAQQALRQLQAMVQQLEGAGGDVGQQAQQLLSELEPEQQAEQGQPQQPQQQPKQQPPQQQQQPQQQDLQQPEQQVLLQQLDWESIIDFPHGSLRLLGSCKAPWMDSDPAWVSEKCYSPVERVDGQWVRRPLTYADVASCSILLSESEMRKFEQSQQFLDAVYRAADSRERLLAAKRLIRAANKEVKRLQELAAAGPPAPPPSPVEVAAAAAERQQALERKQQRQQLRQQEQLQMKAARLQQQAQEEQRKQEQQAALAKLKAAAAAMAAKPQLNQPLLARPRHNFSNKP